MKKIIVLTAITFQVLGTTGQNKKDQLPFLTKSLSDLSIKDVTAETSGGSIYVTGVSNDARIEVYVSSNNWEELTKDEIQKRLDANYNFKISAGNDNLTAVAKVKVKNTDWKKGLNISYRIYVPRDVSANITTSGGSIDLSNLSGEQNFTTSGGSLRIDNLSGQIKGRTSGGSIDLTNSKNEIDLQTSGGSIYASNCDGHLTLSTSGGSVKLIDLNGRIKAHTGGGNVQAERIKGELITSTSGGNIDLRDLSCSVETSTSGGNIDVSMKEFGKYVTINNPDGNIDLKMPGDKGIDIKFAANKIDTNSLNNFSGKVDDKTINGRMNGGGLPVRVLAGSGRIRLSLNE